MKRKCLTALLSSFLGLSVLACSAFAFVPIPQESGFSGFVQIGGGYIRGKTNMISSLDHNLAEIGQESIGSLDDSPNAESDGLPQLNFDLRYTFASTRTQVSFGNRLEDLLRFDFVTQAAVRQEIGNSGIVGLGFLFTSVPTKVWEDPYVVNRNRGETDRKSPGVRLTWENIFGSNLDLEYAYRKIDIDDERSGETQLIPNGVLNPFQATLLDRNGKAHLARAAYLWKIGERHVFTPAVFFVYEDLDGDAMTNYTIDFQPTYGYQGTKFDLVLNAFIGYSDYDKENPIYGKTRDDKRYGLGAIGFWKNPFGWRPFGMERFRFYGQTAYFLSDANIDFYDTEIFIATAGVWFGF